MYRDIQDFVTDWQHESANTVKIFSGITEETKAVKINPNIRSLERLAWHITETITEMGTKAGLFDENPLEHQPTPVTMAQLTATYQEYNQRLAKAVQNRWTNESLTEEVPMYGESWSKGTVLSVLIAHEAHHRSQMTIIMRMVGLPVPGLYGPSQEEWAAMGMPAMQ